jgi:site-specific DNA-cytosine methylase
MHAVIGFIKKHMPPSILLENVAGIADMARGEHKSALDVIVDKLRAFGYSIVCFSFSTHNFVTMNRSRTAIASVMLGCRVERLNFGLDQANAQR